MLNIYKFSVLLLLGLMVLVSYYIVFVKLYKSTKSYIEHEFWFGIDTTIVKMLVFFQVLAIVGFIMSVSSLIRNVPTTGILSKYLFSVLCLFFVSAIVWPYATYYKQPIIVVASLVCTAIASILLLAGSIESDQPKWYIVLGLILLSIVTVLGDGVVWNANYIYKQLYP